MISIGVLAISEGTWLDYRAIQAKEVGLQVSGIIVVLALAFAVSTTYVRIVDRYAPRCATAAMLLGVTPFAAWIAISALSGERARELPGIGLAKIVLTALLIGAAAIAWWLFRWAPRTTSRGWLGVTCSAAFVVCLVAAYLDSHLLVGLYPSLHYLLAVVVVTSAAFVGRVVAQLWRRPRRAVLSVALGLVVASVLVTALGWQSMAAARLSTRSKGVYPKLRSAVSLTTGWTRDDRALGTGQWTEADFRFAPTRHPKAEAIRSATRNVVFVLTDAFREDYVDAKRRGKPLMPFVQEWLASPNVVRFRRARSPSDRTARSMGPLFSSYPTAVVDETARLDLKLESWMNVLRERGFATLSNGNCHYLYRKHREVRLDRCMGAEVVTGSFSAFVSQARKYLSGIADGRPFAIYTHWMDTHVRGRKDTKEKYQLAVAEVDTRMRKWITWMQDTGRYDDTLIVWTADHGYALGEDGETLGKHGVKEHMTHVPFVMHVPGLGERGREITTAVSGVATMATILDVMAPDVDVLVGEHSLLPLVVRDPSSTATRATVVVSTGDEHAVHRDDTKLVVNRQQGLSTLYDTKRDPLGHSPLDDPDLETELTKYLISELQRQNALTAALSKHLPSAGPLKDVPQAAPAKKKRAAAPKSEAKKKKKKKKKRKKKKKKARKRKKQDVPKAG